MRFLLEANLVQSGDKRDPLISLRDADLSGADLFSADLRDADLSAANLRGADLT
jgi:uncharacterized protein YjbI with pentapeptide repeats